MFPKSKHRFVRDVRGHIHHFATYGGGEATTEVTEIDHERGMNDAQLEQLAKNMELPVEDDLPTAVLRKLGLI